MFTYLRSSNIYSCLSWFFFFFVGEKTTTESGQGSRNDNVVIPVAIAGSLIVVLLVLSVSGILCNRYALLFEQFMCKYKINTIYDKTNIYLE